MVRRPLGNHHLGPDTLLVTSDTTRTEHVSAPTERLRERISGARVVLWDFDGPICRLFARHRAELIARDMVDWLAARGLRGLLREEEIRSSDPHYVLRAVGGRHPNSDLVAELEERLTTEELRATFTAMPTAYADPLIRTWAAVGARLAIATNNSPLAVRRYLDGRELTGYFTPHIYGRTQRLDLLKPDPHSLRRALNAMGSAPGDALMIGDTPSDCHAATEAGVPFLGYARNAEGDERLRVAGGDVVVDSLEPVLELVAGGR
ncbi:HAD family hydrolase [Streptomyces flavalbus]|uniref:HAD family hydrolase n=1 Tax=Streptomyces flavalbus TaxID=2665155 RepID=A0ABW2W8V6_9ACTN